MTGNSNEEINYLTICIDEIERRLNLGHRTEWTNHNFNQLSDDIFKKTTIRLSVSSIRRLFGLDKSYKEKYNPQMETKNALARYLGYENWPDYKQKNRIETSSLNEKDLISPPSKETNKKHKYAVLFFIIIAIALFGLFIFKNYKNRIQINIQDINIYAENLSGHTPHTVIVNYTYQDLSDSLFIHFGEKSERLYLPPQNKTITYTYGLPGLHYIRVNRKSNNEIIFSDYAHITTKWWERIVKVKNQNILSEALFVDSLYGRLFTNKEDVALRIFDKANLSDFFVIYINSKDFGISANHFSLQADLKNDISEGGLPCYNARFGIITKEGLVYVTPVGIGCASWAKIRVGKENIEGRYNNLSFLTIDLTKWQTIQIKNKDFKFEVFINDILVYELKHNQTLGNILGIEFDFRGSGAADNIILKDLKGSNVYIEDFERK
jgi:hypothetical protein